MWRRFFCAAADSHQVQLQGMACKLRRRHRGAMLQATTERSSQLYAWHGFKTVATWDNAFPVFMMVRPPDIGKGKVREKDPIDQCWEARMYWRLTAHRLRDRTCLPC